MKNLVALAAALLGAAAAQAAVPNPTVTGPIPDSQGTHGHALWDSWFELGPHGYTEAEYFISGMAVKADGSDPQPFTTRVIVTRPIDAADFNGSLMMDWVNVTAQFENAVDTVAGHDYLMREGWAFVHVSAQAVGICCNSPLALQVWDSARYGELSHPGDDYSFDMFAQIAQALRDPHAADPGAIDMMDGLAVERIVAAGQSQSAGRLKTYLEDVQGGVGGNVIDAFLIHGHVDSGAGPDQGGHGAISTAAQAKATPVLQLSSDFEAYEPDPVANPYYALWEVAGAAHADFWIGVHSEEGQGQRLATGEKLPAEADHDLHVGNPPFTAALNYGEQVDPGQPVCILQGSQFPMHAAVKAGLEALDRWLRDGVQPASSPRYEFEGGALALDEFGNARGGIRYAQVEHPVAHYISTNCVLGGSTIPFTEPEIIALYPTHADYACQMKATLAQNVKDGFMLREEAEALLLRMEGAVNRWGFALEGVDDCDADTIPDDVDNCPLVANASQQDRGGIDTTTPDGIGDACQCGDVSGNGIVNGQDGDAMRRHGLLIEPNNLYLKPGLCDVSGSGTCNGQDGNLTRAVALGHDRPLFGQHCGDADPYAPPCSDCGEPWGGVTYYIEDGPDEQADTLAALFSAVTGDTIEFGPGSFEFDTTLVMAHKQDITIRGQGRDQTVLDFLDSRTPEGISLSHMTGIVIEDLTVWDTPGFSLKISDSNHVVLRDLRTGWSSADSVPGDEIDDRGGMDPTIPSTLQVSCEHELSELQSTGFYTDAAGLQRQYVTDSSNGGYAIYPVLSNDVLIENVIAVGSSDAGIYVGQSNDVIVRDSEALFNVAGFEIENTDNADVFDNVAHCNTGGFLTFDLPGLNQYGERTRTFDNYAGYNNTENFAPGGIVSDVPQGIGMLQLGYDFHEVFGNTIEWNRTVGLVYVSHELVDGNANNPDHRMDLYPEGLFVHDNTFTSNGLAPQPPQEGVIVCEDGTGPGFDDVPPCLPTDVDDGHASLLPTLIAVKGAIAEDGRGPVGAHVVWDGILDLQSNGCSLDPTVQAEGRLDAEGKPSYHGGDDPACRYNDYKFTNPADPGTRRHPLYWSCIPDEGDLQGNTFSADARKYLNFENTDPTDPPLVDIDAHDCPGRFGTQLASLPPAPYDPYVPGVGGDPPPTQAEIDAICADYAGSAINREALPYNCTWLSQYNLFADPTDPRSGAHEGGTLFDLTTPLFSDYATKYRFVFLPPGESASWLQGSSSAPNATLSFPVGTVIAKTFAFPDGGVEDVVETRLLIHRASPDGGSHWEGFAYIWETDGAGNRSDARLAVGGGTAEGVTWNYEDPDPDVTATYVSPPGGTDYAIPHANQCGNCHNNNDLTPGDAPIGPKVRLLNRRMDYGSGPVNQLQHWVDTGLLTGAPALTVDGEHVATNVHRAPRWNVPDDAANLPTAEPGRVNLMTAAEIDEELRVRSWFESNCAHCHNRDGLAQSTGVFLDVFRKVDLNYGICKSPTTAGSSSGGRDFDIVPGAAGESIVSFRIHSVDPSAQMPPIARSVSHDEAVALVDHWIDTTVDSRYAGSGCEGP